jgi:hypothetical protein
LEIEGRLFYVKAAIPTRKIMGSYGGFSHMMIKCGTLIKIGLFIKTREIVCGNHFRNIR